MYVVVSSPLVYFSLSSFFRVRGHQTLVLTPDIRTYAVMPLNEECGLLEWVANTKAFKSILETEYMRKGKKLYSNELHTLLEASRKDGPPAQIAAFKEKILPAYSPTVFHHWFMVTWPEPTAWLASRMAYSRTLAVMSMIGYVLG